MPGKRKKMATIIFVSKRNGFFMHVLNTGVPSLIEKKNTNNYEDIQREGKYFTNT